jgi:hypothetical protein
MTTNGAFFINKVLEMFFNDLLGVVLEVAPRIKIGSFHQNGLDLELLH